MKFRITFTSFFVFLLLSGITSAAILGVYGVITGVAEIKGPTFYAASDEKLLVNEAPSEGGVPGATYDLGDHRMVFFKTFDFGDKQWYPIRANMSANAKLINGSDPGVMRISFGYTDDVGDHIICLSEVVVDSSDYKVYNTSCTGELDGSARRFWYEFTGSTNKTYRIKTWGETKVGVDIDE